MKKLTVLSALLLLWLALVAADCSADEKRILGVPPSSTLSVQQGLDQCGVNIAEPWTRDIVGPEEFPRLQYQIRSKLRALDERAQGIAATHPDRAKAQQDVLRLAEFLRDFDPPATLLVPPLREARTKAMERLMVEWSRAPQSCRCFISYSGRDQDNAHNVVLAYRKEGVVAFTYKLGPKWSESDEITVSGIAWFHATAGRRYALASNNALQSAAVQFEMLHSRAAFGESRAFDEIKDLRAEAQALIRKYDAGGARPKYSMPSTWLGSAPALPEDGKPVEAEPRKKQERIGRGEGRGSGQPRVRPRGR